MSRSEKKEFRQVKSVGFVQAIGIVFEPFIGQGMTSISGLEKDQVSVTLLHYTGTAQSFYFRKCLAIFEGNLLWLRCFSAGN